MFNIGIDCLLIYIIRRVVVVKPEIKPEWVEKYTDSFASHLRYYRQAADKLGVDKSLVLIHDNSKSMDEEFPWYVRRFGGEIKDDPEWLAAWNHHIHNNPHHWEYWITPGGNNEPNTILPMPERYVLEMVADWMGSGRAYTGDWDMTDWLSRNLSKIKIHNKTRDNVEKILVDKLGYGKQNILLWRWSLK
jgi:hypothetical protein